VSAGLDPERVAEILVDAYALGDAPAARKWSCSRRTVERYRARLKTDKVLAAIVQEKRELAEEELATLRVRFLRKALVVLEKKITKAKATVFEVAGAVKIVGELHQLALEVEDDERPSGQDPEDSSVEGGEASAPFGAH
jgi:hypothetical protein